MNKDMSKEDIASLYMAQGVKYTNERKYKEAIYVLSKARIKIKNIFSHLNKNLHNFFKLLLGCRKTENMLVSKRTIQCNII